MQFHAITVDSQNHGSVSLASYSDYPIFSMLRCVARNVEKHGMAWIWAIQFSCLELFAIVMIVYYDLILCILGCFGFWAISVYFFLICVPQRMNHQILTCFSDQSSFRQISSSDVDCAGISTGYCYTLTFECTVIEGWGTVWRGTAFDCENSNDEIVLLHSQFLNGTSGTCNNGTFVGQDVRVDNDIYFVSQLSVLVTLEIIGKTIECVHESYQSDSTTVSVDLVGYFTIRPISGIS